MYNTTQPIIPAATVSDATEEATLPTLRAVSPRRESADTQLRYADTSWARKRIDVLAPALGTFPSASSVVAAVLDGCRLSEEVSAAMAKYKPCGLDAERPELEAFARDACMLAAPATAYTGERLLSVAGPFVVWCVKEQGWPLQADVIFSRQAIDMYCTEDKRGRSEGTRRNYRAILMRISEVVAPDEHPDALTPLSRKRIASPYSAAEMDGFRLWALGQVNAEKRRKAMLMLIFCAGAGLRSSDIAQIFADDVTVDAEGVVITVRGTNPREVPLLREWEQWVIPALEASPMEFPLWGKPNRTNGSNLLSSFTQYTVGAYPRGDRLRATWIVAHLQAGTRMKELFTALGFDKFENLPRYLEFVSSLDQTDYRAALRGGGDR
ncbi:MAG: hypothetical protein QOD05_927 [Microbacteriaceae bacterium]|nr:hypothetical protein [Microbacteriaceae bacterium]